MRTEIVPDAVLVHPRHRVVLVERLVAAEPCFVELSWQCRNRLPDDAQIAHAGRNVAITELVGHDDVLLGPQHEHRLITAFAVIGALGRALRCVNDGGAHVECRDPLRLPALQVEDKLLVGRGQPLQGRALRRHRCQPVLQQRQVVLVEAVEKITCGLCRREFVADLLPGIPST
jgi:hypothetical protein